MLRWSRHGGGPDVAGYSPLQCCPALDLQLAPFFALCPLLGFNCCAFSNRQEKVKAAGHNCLPPVNTIIVRQSTFAFALFGLGATEHDIVDVDVAAIGVISWRNGDLK